ncbi:MAG: ATP-binding cassette domain-containing protein [Spirochaetes bacterium]|nr:ATP-binding cassette domain-containing protein [Spirochaetota bacterium]
MIPVIEFKNVKVKYNYDLDDYALDIDELIIGHNENVAIIGPNGAGKSSFINLISRDNYPEPEDNSVCNIYGSDRWDVFELRSHLGIVSPNYQHKIGVEATVLDTVISGFFSSIGIIEEADVKVSMTEKALDALEFFGISGLADRMITELSTGQSRLVLIARALIHDPESLILDEPASGLDIKAAHLFRQNLIKLADHGTNIIVVTHNFEDIVSCINRVIILKNGRIFKDGPCEEVITDENLSELYSMDINVKQSKHGYIAELSDC